MAITVKTERDKQAAKVHRLYAYLHSRPNEWIPLPELSRAIASECGSTKISQARKHAARDDSEIIWNHDPNASAYMLRPIRLGRDAAEPTDAPWNQDRPFAEPFRLKP